MRSPPQRPNPPDDDEDTDDENPPRRPPSPAATAAEAAHIRAGQRGLIADRVAAIAHRARRRAQSNNPPRRIPQFDLRRDSGNNQQQNPPQLGFWQPVPVNAGNRNI